MASTVQEITLELPHIRLAGWVSGSEDQPLLLALHGWLDNANSFLPLAASLADYQIMALDWPGHGLSAHRAPGYPLHWVDYLYDLHAVLMTLKARGQRPKAILGHSLGGMLALAYCASHQDAADALILIEALGMLSEHPSHATNRLKQSVAKHWDLQHAAGLKATAINNSSEAASTQDKALKPDSKPGNMQSNKPSFKPYPSLSAVVDARHRLTGLATEAALLLAQRNFAPVAGGVLARTDPRLKLDSPLRLTPEHANAFLRLNVPGLLLLGNEGFDSLQHAKAQAQQVLKALTVWQLPGCHHLHMTHSDEVAAAIKAFLQP